MIHEHKIISKKITRCRTCLKKLVPDMEWCVWVTKEEEAKKQKRKDDWLQSLKGWDQSQLHTPVAELGICWEFKPPVISTGSTPVRGTISSCPGSRTVYAVGLGPASSEGSNPSRDTYKER